MSYANRRSSHTSTHTFSTSKAASPSKPRKNSNGNYRKEQTTPDSAHASLSLAKSKKNPAKRLPTLRNPNAKQARTAIHADTIEKKPSY